MLEHNQGPSDPDKDHSNELNLPGPSLSISTSRFGNLLLDRSKIISIQDGIRGFPDSKEYALLSPREDPFMFWLQSLQDPALAFVVTDPTFFFEEYRATGFTKALHALGMERIENALLLVVVNKIDGRFTANLKGPIVVNPKTTQAVQVVLSGDRWGTREPLFPR